MENLNRAIRDQKWGYPCIVIDDDGTGDFSVYADPGVLVFSRYARDKDKEFRFEEVNVIPFGWLDTDPGDEAASDAEKRADAVAKAWYTAEGDPDDE